MATKMNVAHLMATLAGVFKALPDDKLADLNDALTPNVTSRGSDQWADPRPAADQRRLAFGPEQSASGSGGSEMTAEYSTPGPETGSGDKATRLGQLLDQIKTLLAVPGNRPTSGSVAGDTFLGKADSAILQAKTALRKATILEIEGDSAGRAQQLVDANAALGKAVSFLKASSEAMEDTGDEDADEDGVDRRTNQVRGLYAKAQRMAGNTDGATNALGIERGLSVEQFLSGVAGAGGRAPEMRKSIDANLPPDMTPKFAPVVSISDKIEAALDAGEITAEQGTIAYSRLQALNIAREGRLPMGSVLEQLKGKDTPESVRNLFGIEVVPAQLRLH
jgi:hypothetical protein